MASRPPKKGLFQNKKAPQVNTSRNKKSKRIPQSQQFNRNSTILPPFVELCIAYLEKNGLDFFFKKKEISAYAIKKLSIKNRRFI